MAERTVCIGSFTLLLIILLLQALSARAAEPFSLAFPVDCSLGQDCIIQNYVDIDPGSGWKDYNCGLLTYDGHKGTDIRLQDLAMMTDGVAVFAASDGVVIGTRNMMPDRKAGQSYDDYVKKVSGRECGNGVVLAHDSGHETLYCHMMKGSIAVKTGDRVKVGDFLGHIGLSGKTQFPHLHISVRKDKQVIAPFVGPCSSSRDYLWHDPFDYAGTLLLKSGFTDVPPTLDSIETGQTSSLTAASGALIFWANVVGIRAGDRQEIVIIGPGDKTIADNTRDIKKSKVNWLGYVGKKRPRSGWPSGTYIGVYRLLRDGDVIIQKTIKTVVR